MLRADYGGLKGAAADGDEPVASTTTVVAPPTTLAMAPPPTADTRPIARTPPHLLAPGGRLLAPLVGGGPASPVAGRFP